MTIPIAYPVGIIEEHDGGNAIMMLMRRDDHRNIQPGAQVTVWNQHGAATVRFRGVVTEVMENNRASFLVTHSELDPGWPERLDPMGMGMGVYLAQNDSFEANMMRVCNNQDEYLMLMEFARMHEKDTGMESYAALAQSIMYQDDPDQKMGPVE